MNWMKMFPGKYLASAEFDGKDVTLTIANVTLEDLPEEKGGTKRRGILAFKETPKALVLNRTNGTALMKCFGPETDSWKGKRVTLYPAPFTDPFTGELGTAIRVRGSPDIAEPIQFTAKIGRKQMQFKLLRTGQSKAAVPAPVPARSDADDFTPSEIADAGVFT